ncbi:uncharacterized protein LOC131242641 [Magnolia sinica]|uniref:uncharacterized protein LOC131242641 n=1 Tax=Magnolia sinica TaxID=86752 RepID=UPI00265A652C|nr:uncharacterized protein LOC131242641 [Magnolia sinica]
MLHPRKGIASGYHADSDNSIRTIGDFNGSNGVGFGKPTLRINGNKDDHGIWSGIEFSARTQLEEDSGISSPPLWKMSPPRDPPTKAYRFHHHLNPTLRSQAIADGRRELMEMIQNAPDSAYELSLKDLVELPLNKGVRQATLEERGLTNETIHEEKKVTTKMKKNGGKGHGLKHGKVDNGAFLLKMFFPTLGLKKRSSGVGTCSKVSPKPPPAEGEKAGFEKGVDGEWWKKQNSAGGESDSSGRSGSSGSSNSSGRQMSGVIPGCWSIFHTKDRKGREHRR